MLRAVSFVFTEVRSRLSLGTEFASPLLHAISDNALSLRLIRVHSGSLPDFHGTLPLRSDVVVVSVRCHVDEARVRVGTPVKDYRL
jgi:type III secretory pathway component EscT